MENRLGYTKQDIELYFEITDKSDMHQGDSEELSYCYEDPFKRILYDDVHLIKKKLNEEEIEKYHLLEMTNKYNL